MEEVDTGKSEYVYYNPELNELRCCFTHGDLIVIRDRYTYHLMSSIPEVTTTITINIAEPIKMDRYYHPEQLLSNLNKGYVRYACMCTCPEFIINDDYQQQNTTLWEKFKRFLKGEVYEEKVS